MINGEGTTTPSDQIDEFSHWVDQKKPSEVGGNVSPDLSLSAGDYYSSCGESEFDRYCSANSVMGTPSLCSSVGTFNDFLDLDRNSGGDKSTVSTSGGFDRGEFYNDDMDIEGNRMSSSFKNSSKSLSRSEEKSSFFRTTCDGNLGGSSLVSKVVGAKNNEQVHDLFDPFNVRESGSVEEEDGTSSRYEHSDDDDDGSMFNCGTDDEGRMDSYNIGNFNYFQGSKTNNDYPLLVGSAVAFGSEDWDDFMQETEGNNLASLSLDEPKDKQLQDLARAVVMVPSSAPNVARSEQAEIVRNVHVTNFLANGKEDLECCSTRYSLPHDTTPLLEKASLQAGLNINYSATEGELQCTSIIEPDVGNASENDFLGKSKKSETVVQLTSAVTLDLCGKEAAHFEDQEVPKLPQAIEDDFKVCVNGITKNSPALVNGSEKHLAPIKVRNFEIKESYDDVVLDMEEILLDSMESHGARFLQNNRSPQPFRDGSSTASTSGTDEAYPLVQHPSKIDGVEVVGAKQKKGDVSLGERLVGVKEYTVYLLRVWSGKDQWEVERRYRDFFALYRQLKTLYANHGWALPTPWSRVEQQSRKFFGTVSANVVSERSTLIQECLRSILHSGTPHSAPGTLNWFLSPHKVISSSSLLNTLDPQSTSAFTGGTPTEDVSTFGKTISLLVEIQPRKSGKQLLEAQHYLCAGCHKRLDAEKTLMREFVHTLGWGKPRLCEYTGQLFCASCHTSETAVIPARVLHFWDFTYYPVSQMAKSYLDSIYDQPMLCVSAVNPFLLSKVPALLHVTGIRKKIGAMMPYVRCPFRRSIQKGVGSRRYLLESSEFFALRDLVDLSKGAFAALPLVVEMISTKILDHITQRCLICYDVGIPCGARKACEDPSSLIFPFQEDGVKRCKSCDSVFHKPCFKNLSNCPCGAGSKVRNVSGPTHEVNHDSSNNCNEVLNVLARNPDSGSPAKFLSYLFSNRRQEKAMGRSNSNPVILMNSLPSTFSDPL